MNRYQNKLWVALVFLLLLAGVAKILWGRLHADVAGLKQTELITPEGNIKTTISNWKGKVVIVSCFQSWCGDCVRETVVLNQLATELNSDELKIIYISDESAEKINRFRNRVESDKILFTMSQTSLDDLGISVFPTTFLLNKNGDVVQTKREAYNWMLEKATIAKMIAD